MFEEDFRQVWALWTYWDHFPIIAACLYTQCHSWTGVILLLKYTLIFKFMSKCPKYLIDYKQKKALIYAQHPPCTLKGKWRSWNKYIMSYACLLWKWRKIPSEITQIFGYFDLLWGIEQSKKLSSIVKGETKLFT